MKRRSFLKLVGALPFVGLAGCKPDPERFVGYKPEIRVLHRMDVPWAERVRISNDVWDYEIGRLLWGGYAIIGCYRTEKVVRCGDQAYYADDYTFECRRKAMT